MKIFKWLTEKKDLRDQVKKLTTENESLSKKYRKVFDENEFNKKVIINAAGKVLELETNLKNVTAEKNKLQIRNSILEFKKK